MTNANSPLSKPNWELRPQDEAQVREMSQALKLSPTVARILLNRKITTPEAAANFLNAGLNQIHEPFLLKDMDRACARVLQAIHNQEKICIYGDYDVDGAVATSLLVLFFQDVGVAVDYYIPNRLIEGYSLNKTALTTLQERGVKLIITVDNGIMAHNEVDFATELGIDIVVTDHHQVAETLPNAAAIVNPQRKDCTYPFKGICGAGVAFKLMAGLRQKLRETNYFTTHKEPNLKHYFDLLCIPTVCDVVPLVDENRIIVKEGLKHLSRTKRPGLQALAKVCGLDGKELSSYDLGFKFGPRINACGRLVDATLGVKLLLAKTTAEAQPLAEQLNNLNLERRALEQDITAEAFEKIKNEVTLTETLGLMIFDPSWHIGVVGIVASRLMEKFNRPVFVLAQTEGGSVKGSGRSIPGVSLIQALRQCEAVLKVYGGHEAAAGVTLDPENVPEFAKLFDQAIKEQMQPKDLQRKIWIDGELTLPDINEKLIAELSLLEPFGMGNAKPLFASSGLTVQSKRIVGENHVKLKFSAENKNLDAIAFNKSEAFSKLTGSIGALYGLELNEYNNQTQIQLVIKDFF